MRTFFKFYLIRMFQNDKALTVKVIITLRSFSKQQKMLNR